MNTFGRLRNAYDSSPGWLRVLAGVPLSNVPKGLIYGAAYRSAWAVAEGLVCGTPWQVERSGVDRLRDYLEWAGSNVPYYRELFRQLGFAPGEIRNLRDIEALPILTKKMVRELGDALEPDTGPVPGRVTTTGGSTGEPLSFRVSHDASAAEWAFVEHLWSMTGYGPTSRRAVLRGQLIPGRASGAVGWRDPLNRALLLSSGDLSSSTVEKYARELVRFRPDFLHAYPSTACTLARLLDREVAQSLRLKAILISSENVYPADRHLLEDVFGAPVVSLYGLSEKVAMACECEYEGSYHIAEGHSVLELVDERGRAVRSAGIHGRIVGTSLLNRGTALIRYETGDSAAYPAGDCKCGRSGRRLSQLIGHRDLEVLHAVDGTAIPATAFLHAVHDPAFALALQFRFVQTQPGQATLVVVLKSGVDRSQAEALRRVFAQRLENRVVLDVKVVDHIPVSTSGKYRYVTSSVSASGCLEGACE